MKFVSSLDHNFVLQPTKFYATPTLSTQWPLLLQKAYAICSTSKNYILFSFLFFSFLSFFLSFFLFLFIFLSLLILPIIEELVWCFTRYWLLESLWSSYKGGQKKSPAAWPILFVLLYTMQIFFTSKGGKRWGTSFACPILCCTALSHPKCVYAYFIYTILV